MVFEYWLFFLLVSVGCSVAAKSSNGEACIFRDSGQFGVCVPLSSCSYAQSRSCSGIPPQTCPSFAADSSVCCNSVDSCPPLPPSVTAPLTGYKAWDYCAGIAELAYPCEWMDDSYIRVQVCTKPPATEDTEATVQTGEYPHFVLLSNGQIESEIIWTSSSTIGGTLVTDKWVLSSAYLISSRTFAKVGGIVDGGAVYKVKRNIPHPEYLSPRAYNNVGLVELETSVTFSKNVLPACLHTGSLLPKEKLKEISRQSSIYHSWDVTITSNEVCVDEYSIYDVIVPGGVNKLTQFCTTRLNNNMGATLNGAPLQVYNGASVACTQTVFGVFASLQKIPLITRVAAYIPWIEGYVWP